MKKNLIIALLFFGFVSINCSAQSSVNDQRIVGTWVNNDLGNVTIVFNANGSGSIKVIYHNDIKKEGFSDYEASFTYGISMTGLLRHTGYKSDGIIDITGTLYFSPDGKTLIFSNYAFRKR